MFENLESVMLHFEDIERELMSPGIASDQARFRKLMKEQSDLAPVVSAYKEYKESCAAVDESLQMLEEESDEEMRELAKEELSSARERISQLEEKIKILLIPKDPNDDKNVIVEIRAGAGGDEAALFAAEIYRMYIHYAEGRGWRSEILDFEEIGIGGMKSVSFMIKGQGAYSRMKYESGVHRVQRVPATESGGRIHTSTITVAVMPEADEDIVIDIPEKDVRQRNHSCRIRPRPGRFFARSSMISRCRSAMMRKQTSEEARSGPETAPKRSGHITSLKDV